MAARFSRRSTPAHRARREIQFLKNQKKWRSPEAPVLKVHKMDIATAASDCKQISQPSRQPADDLARLLPTQSADVPLGSETLPDSEFILSALRAASLRARLVATELDTVGVALKRKMIPVEVALSWLHDIDLLDHVIYRSTDAH
jgi:hypothetical protein